jgi:glycogen phosphorylase
MENSAVMSPVSFLFHTDVKGIESLAQLALDMRWSGSHYEDEIWRKLEPELWDSTHNAWLVLRTVSRDKIAEVLADPGFRKEVDDRLETRNRQAAESAWFQKAHPDEMLSSIAYFSMEFMLSESLPIYSGGLGNVAGDQLKAASDLGVPITGIGLLYQQGYFRQMIDKDGKQQALYPFNDPGQLPILPLRKPDGEWLRLEMNLGEYRVWLRAWQVQVGRVKLYLLDSNDEMNSPAQRVITGELYGGGTELRFKQELVLGIGGWRLLKAVGLEPQVCHLNEGHAAFAILERARAFMEETGEPFEVALASTRAGNVFTTHTAVPAGFDKFPPGYIERYLKRYAAEMQITTDELLKLGRINGDDELEPFNMAYLAIRGSGSINGVSQLHGRVSRHIFADLFPEWPEAEVPVGHVTNGIHVPSWDSKASAELWTQACGKECWRSIDAAGGQNIRNVSDQQLWELRAKSRKGLVEFARQRLSRELAAGGALSENVELARHLFDFDTLTIGFARRFATYKRPNLLLHDPERLKRILANQQRPVQLIIAGKAHPADEAGQALIEKWIRFIRRTDARSHAIFLGDYDMNATENLVQGVDVWLNTPRRPWEACGTSGMKVLVNGGLNLSELDGWWAEAYTPEVGWAIGDKQEHGEDAKWDAQEADALYNLLEQAVIPEFYSRDSDGIPVQWIKRIRESMARLTPVFSADRTVRDYTEKHYIPAARECRVRTADKGARGKELVQWYDRVEQHWSKLRFGEMKVETSGDKHVFEVQVYIDGLEPEFVSVELCAQGTDSELSTCSPMERVRVLVGAANGYVYRIEVPSTRPASDFTARMLPHQGGVNIPLESARILWQR